MANRSRNWRKAPTEINPRPLSGDRRVGTRLHGSSERQGALERGTARTRTMRRDSRKRAASYVGIGVAALVGLVVIALAWVGIATVLAHRGISGSLGGDRELAKAIRRPTTATGALPLAVAFVKDGKLQSSAILGVDTAGKHLWLLSVPANSAVPVGSNVVRIGEAFAQSGPAPLVHALESVASTEVAGYMEIDAGGLPAIDAQPAAQGSTDAVANRTLMLPLVRALAETQDSYGLTALTRSMKGTLRTTLSSAQVAELSAAAEKAMAGGLVSAEAPQNGASNAVLPTGDELVGILKRLVAGTASVSSAKSAPSVDAGKVSVTIRNGIGVTGVGADAARRLKEAGYKIGDVGNAAQFVYPETLVVYTDNENAARQVAAQLPVGRVIQSRGMYGFPTTVLVIIGRDWVGAQ